MAYIGLKTEHSSQSNNSIKIIQLMENMQLTSEVEKQTQDTLSSFQ